MYDNYAMSSITGPGLMHVYRRRDERIPGELLPLSSKPYMDVSIVVIQSNIMEMSSQDTDTKEVDGWSRDLILSSIERVDLYIDDELIDSMGLTVPEHLSECGPEDLDVD